MLNKNAADNQAKLLEEIVDIKNYLAIIEHEINSSGHVELLSDDQVQAIWRKLRTAGNFIYSANYYWARYTNNRALIKKFVEMDHEETVRILGKEANNGQNI